MLYGYARCSTNETKQDVEYQRKQLKAQGVDKDNIYFEYESGTKINRLQLKRLLDTVGEGDSIIVTEVSRITRSTKQLCDIIELCQNKHIRLVICNSITIDCTVGKLDPMTKAFLQMAGVFAELERDMISQRVKSGLSNAKAKGVKLGRPTIGIKDISAKVIKTWDLYQSGSITKTDYARICGISRPTLDKYLAVLSEA